MAGLLSAHQRNTIIFNDNEQGIAYEYVEHPVSHKEIRKLLGVKDNLNRKHSLFGSRK